MIKTQQPKVPSQIYLTNEINRCKVTDNESEILEITDVV